MTPLRQACAAAALVWTGMHLWHGATHLRGHSVPELDTAALVLLAVVTAWATLPLYVEDRPLAVSAAWAMAGGGLIVTLAVLPFLDHDALRSYAAWPTGGMGVLIAALVMRRRGPAGWVLALGVVGVIQWCVAATGGLDPAWMTSLSIPPLLWLGGAHLVRFFFDRADTEANAYLTAADSAHIEAACTAIRDRESAVRRDELEADVVPLFRRILAADEIDPQLVAESERAEAELRDCLSARALLTVSIRDLVARARARGSRIILTDNRPPRLQRPLPPSAVAALEVALSTADQMTGVYQVSADGAAMTMYLQGGADAIGSTASALRAIGGLSVEADEAEIYVKVDLV